MSAHPYGKDASQSAPAWGIGPSSNYLMRQPTPVPFRVDDVEAPDPAFWVPRGYVVINCDLRGFGSSEGQGNLLTEAEGLDYHDLIGVGCDPAFSTGKIGLCGVSLSGDQPVARGSNPASASGRDLSVEGFTDAYRDLVYPGESAKTASSVMWSKSVKRSGRYQSNSARNSLHDPCGMYFGSRLRLICPPSPSPVR